MLRHEFAPFFNINRTLNMFYVLPPEILQHVFGFLPQGPVRARIRRTCKYFLDNLANELVKSSYTKQQKMILKYIRAAKQTLIWCIVPRCGRKVIIATLAMLEKKPIVVLTADPSHMIM